MNLYANQIMALGRTFLGIGQTIVFFSAVESLFVPVGDKTLEDRCESLYGSISHFCYIDSLEISATIHLIILSLVVSGMIPGIISILHAYTSVSFIAALSLPDGGDLIASNISLILMFAYLGDKRIWHWESMREDANPIFKGIRKGASFALMVQVAFIYANSAIAKLSVDTWAEGSQIYYVTRQEFFGSSGLIGDIARNITSFPLITLILSWGVILVELLIAILIFIPRKNLAIIGISLGVILHIAIIFLIGLFSFSIIMIGVILMTFGLKFESFGEFKIALKSLKLNYLSVSKARSKNYEK